MNLCEAANVLGISRQRVHQIARHRGIGSGVSSGKRQRWDFSEHDLDMIRKLKGIPAYRQHEYLDIIEPMYLYGRDEAGRPEVELNPRAVIPPEAMDIMFPGRPYDHDIPDDGVLP